MNTKEHWDSVYSSKSDVEVSWTQKDAHASLSLIAEVCASGRVIDIGCGTSVLTDRLLDAGYSVAVLDISAKALERAKTSLEDRANKVRWIVADITQIIDVGKADVWHDRAVFHFLTEPDARSAYVRLLTKTVDKGGHVVIATFALDGPEKCSGLSVMRYDGQSLAIELGDSFQLIKSVPEIHTTPWGKPQAFQYSVFKRV